MRSLAWVLGPLLGVLVLLVAWVKYQEQRGIFFPRTYDRGAMRRLPADIEFVTFDGEGDVRLSGFWRPGEAGSPVAVLAHGNAGHALDRLFWFEAALPPDWHGLVFDYRGYGRSSGVPSEEGLYDDARRAARWARRRADGGPLVLHGRSLGVPVVAHAAMHTGAAGLVLESGFPDARSVARSILPLPGIGYLLGVRFDTVEYVRRAQRRHGPIPKLVIHGRNDRVLPFELGESLHRRLPEPRQRWFVDGAGHNDLVRRAGERYAKRVRGFLRAVLEDQKRSGS